MAMVPTVSIIVATKNRAKSLRRCLDALSLIRSEVPWEVVVVDNGSTDDTSHVVEEFIKFGRGMAIATVYEAIAGAGRAKNTGLKVAKGEFVAFIDDDCYVMPDHVDQVVDLFRSPDIGYGGGKVTLFDPTDYPITIQLHEQIIIVPPRSYVETGMILGANMAFRRVVLDQISGFDPDFGPGNKYIGDDPDVQVRASFAGWHGKYDPALKVGHHHGRNATAARRLTRTYQLATGAYFAKFLLRPDTRREFARNIYWRVRRKNVPWTMLLTEAEGAIGYLLLRALRRRSVSIRGRPHGSGGFR